MLKTPERGCIFFVAAYFVVPEVRHTFNCLAGKIRRVPEGLNQIDRYTGLHIGKAGTLFVSFERLYVGATTALTVKPETVSVGVNT